MSIAIAVDAFIKKLKIEMPPLLKAEQIGLCLPADSGDKFLLGVFVYSVMRDIKAQMNGNIRIDPSTSVKAPITVELKIAVTSYAGKKSGIMDDYKLLERVIQICHDNSEVPLATALQPSYIVAPRLELLNLEQDEISKIAQFASDMYTLSVFYKIAPIAIPSRIQMISAPIGSVDYSGGDKQ